MFKFLFKNFINFEEPINEEQIQGDEDQKFEDKKQELNEEEKEIKEQELKEVEQRVKGVQRELVETDQGLNKLEQDSNEEYKTITEKDFIGKKIKHRDFGLGIILDAYEIPNEKNINLTVEFEDKKQKEIVYPKIIENKIVEFLEKRFNTRVLEINYENNQEKTKENINESNKIYEKVYFDMDQNENYRQYEVFDKIIDDLKDIEELRFFAKLFNIYNLQNNAIITNLKAINDCTIMKYIINKSVKEREQGDGIIDKIYENDEKETIVRIKYNSGINKEYKYPYAFREELRINDEKTKRIIENEIIIQDGYKAQNELREKYKDILKETEFDLLRDIEDSETTDLKIITGVDCIVVKGYNGCDFKNHQTENITAKLKIKTKEDKIIQKKITASYCKDCKKYYILSTLLKEILNIGLPICNLDTTFIDLENSYNGNDYLKEKSILSLFGYNVGQKENLSKQYRQHILAYLIDNGILTKQRIISYLNYFIKQREFSEKDFSIAIYKWQEDIDFVNDYRIGEYRQVLIRKLKYK